MNPEQKPIRPSPLSDSEFAARQQESKNLMLVSSNPARIQGIENPSESVQIRAVQENAFVLEYIKNPSEAVQLAACAANGDVIRIIKNPSEAVQWRQPRTVANPQALVAAESAVLHSDRTAGVKTEPKQSPPGAISCSTHAKVLDFSLNGVLF